MSGGPTHPAPTLPPASSSPVSRSGPHITPASSFPILRSNQSLSSSVPGLDQLTPPQILSDNVSTPGNQMITPIAGPPSSRPEQPPSAMSTSIQQTLSDLTLVPMRSFQINPATGNAVTNGTNGGGSTWLTNPNHALDSKPPFPAHPLPSARSPSFLNGAPSGHLDSTRPPEGETRLLGGYSPPLALGHPSSPFPIGSSGAFSSPFTVLRNIHANISPSPLPKHLITHHPSLLGAPPQSSYNLGPSSQLQPLESMPPLFQPSQAPLQQTQSLVSRFIPPLASFRPPQPGGGGDDVAPIITPMTTSTSIIPLIEPYQPNQQQSSPSYPFGGANLSQQSLRQSPIRHSPLLETSLLVPQLSVHPCPKGGKVGPRAAAPPRPVTKLQPKVRSRNQTKRLKAIELNDLDDITTGPVDPLEIVADQNNHAESAASGSVSRAARAKALVQQQELPRRQQHQQLQPPPTAHRQVKITQRESTSSSGNRPSKKPKRREKTASTKSLPHIPLIDVNGSLTQLTESQLALHGDQSEGGKVFLSIDDLYAPRHFCSEYLESTGQTPYTRSTLIASSTDNGHNQAAASTMDDNAPADAAKPAFTRVLSPQCDKVIQHLSIPFGKFSLSPQPDSFLNEITLGSSIAPLSEEETVLLYREPSYLAYLRLRACNPRVQYMSASTYLNPHGFAPGQIRQTERSAQKSKFLLSLLKTRWESYVDPSRELWLRQRVARCVTELPEIILFWPASTADVGNGGSGPGSRNSTAPIATPFPDHPATTGIALSNPYMADLDLNTDPTFCLLQYAWCKTFCRQIELKDETFLEKYYPAPTDIKRYLQPAGQGGRTLPVQDCVISQIPSSKPGYYKRSLFYYALTIFNRDAAEIDAYYCAGWISRIPIPTKMLDFQPEEIRAVYPDPPPPPPSAKGKGKGASKSTIIAQSKSRFNKNHHHMHFDREGSGDEDDDESDTEMGD